MEEYTSEEKGSECTIKGRKRRKEKVRMRGVVCIGLRREMRGRGGEYGSLQRSW